MTINIQIPENGQWTKYGRGGSGPAPPPNPPGYATLVLDEEFVGGSVNSARWHVYDDAVDGHFGGTTRIQVYKPANVSVGAGSTGALGAGNSMKLKSLEVDAGSGTLPSLSSAGTRYSYTAAMLDSKTAGVYYPRYPRFEWRVKSPHGQGLWPALWLTARIGGATEAEFDIFEYFHSQLPAKNSTTLHRTNNSGVFQANAYTNNGAAGASPRTFFETPTYTPSWHVWAAEIAPVTDSTGATTADPSQPSSFVRYRVFLDQVKVVEFVDTSATHYTTNGGSDDSFWNVYMQGCQIDGNFVGHPEDPQLAFSHWTGNCLISGSSGSCTTTTGGFNVQRAHFGDPASTLELNYMKVWKFTG